MSWEKISEDVKFLIYTKRFVIMAENKLHSMLDIDDDIPYNPHANIPLILKIWNQLHLYNYYEKDKYIEQALKFLNTLNKPGILQF
tara:strand:+ start:153 stop:410 length:258 start_codon:yes stop_codon:yes gene_type:complete